MVVAGKNEDFLDLADVEVLDLSSPFALPCYVPAPLPMADHALVGNFVDGTPIVCGGRHTPNCYRYKQYKCKRARATIIGRHSNN